MHVLVEYQRTSPEDGCGFDSVCSVKGQVGVHVLQESRAAWSRQQSARAVCESDHRSQSADGKVVLD